MERIELLQLMGFTEEEAIAKATEEETIRATFRTTATPKPTATAKPRVRGAVNEAGTFSSLHHRRQRRDLGPLLPPERLWLLTDRSNPDTQQRSNTL